jgi:hypothetical protein
VSGELSSFSIAEIHSVIKSMGRSQQSRGCMDLAHVARLDKPEPAAYVINDALPTPSVTPFHIAAPGADAPLATSVRRSSHANQGWL